MWLFVAHYSIYSIHTSSHAGLVTPLLHLLKQNVSPFFGAGESKSCFLFHLIFAELPSQWTGSSSNGVVTTER